MLAKTLFRAMEQIRRDEFIQFLKNLEIALQGKQLHDGLIV